MPRTVGASDGGGGWIASSEAPAARGITAPQGACATGRLRTVGARRVRATTPTVRGANCPSANSPRPARELG